MPKRKRRKPVGPRADKGVPVNCRDTQSMRIAIARLRNAMKRGRQLIPSGPHQISKRRVARVLGIPPTTLTAYLSLKRWPPDRMLGDIFAMAATLEERLAEVPVPLPVLDLERDLENYPFQSMLAVNPWIAKTYWWSLDTSTIAGYSCTLPALSDELV